MSQKIKKIYICQKCDAQFSKWNGRCLECGGWGTLGESTQDLRQSEKAEIKMEPAAVYDLSQVNSGQTKRIRIGIGEVDRVLGGGLVPGSIVLLAGEPGVGKSTLLAQLADATKRPFVYASGEESANQTKDRLERLRCNLANIQFINETNVEKIISRLEVDKPALAIIDSIQAVYSLLSQSEPGSVNQIRTGTMRFLEIAKKMDIAIILAGHITKDGAIAGPKSLEHIVDTVLYLESDKSHQYRILRATKNRFGSVNEVGIFEMTGSGFKEVANPSSIFIETGQKSITGSVISVVMEGTRPFLIEIQALVTKTVFGYPQRKSSGFDLNRLQVLAAVLTKRANVNLTNQDIILNIVGGLKVSDPGIDLAVCLAVASSLTNQVLDRKMIILGEVGLGGEVRNIGKLKERLGEAVKLGFNQALVPGADIKIAGMKIVSAQDISQAIKKVIIG